MNNIIVTGDVSYDKKLAAEFNALTTTLEDTNNKETVLIVDTGDIYEYYKGAWYLL
jgi:hypothetical protein